MVYANASQVGCGEANGATNTGIASRRLCVFNIAYNQSLGAPYIATNSGTINVPASGNKSSTGVGVATLFSSTMQQQLIQTLNDYRTTVNPAAADMQVVTYNATLASIASNVIGSCGLLNISTNGDTIDGTTYGTTIVVDPTLAFTLPGIISEWMSGSTNYNYAINKATAYAGSYLQLVTSDSSQVGCAYANCITTYNWVCMFNKPYYSATQPYTAGTSCTPSLNTCVKYYPDTTTVCNDGLCGSAANEFVATNTSTTESNSTTGNTGSSSNGSNNGLSDATDAGIAIGVTVGITLLAGVAYYCYKKYREPTINYVDSENYVGDENYDAYQGSGSAL